MQNSKKRQGADELSKQNVFDKCSFLCAQGPKGTAHQDMQIKKSNKISGGVFSTNCKSKIMDKGECAGVCGNV